jgi:hypothetical protein
MKGGIIGFMVPYKEFTSGFDIPQPNRAIQTHSGQLPAIGTEKNRVDFMFVAQDSPFRCTLDIPKVCCAIPTGSSQICSIRAEGNGANPVSVA